MVREIKFEFQVTIWFEKVKIIRYFSLTNKENKFIGI